MIRLNGLTGGLLGSGVVALGFAGSVVLAPPAPQATSDAQIIAPVNDPPSPPAPQEAPTGNTTATIPEVNTEPVESTLPKPGPKPGLLPEDLTAPQDAEPPVPSPVTPPAMPETETPRSEGPAAIAESDSPALPSSDLHAAPGRLPGKPIAPRDQDLPQTPEAPQASDNEAPADTTSEAPRLPGNRILGMPGQPAKRAAPEPETAPDAEQERLTALERNSNFSGSLTGAPLMTVVLNDPGLPTPLRRALAALELPVTIALNPMDPSATQAAEIYRAAGKEVLLLANGLPNGARATDLDVTFSAWFDAVPQAVGVLDLPRGGFARNANLTTQVLPLIARDGHGLVSFAGGLSRVDSAAARAGVPHAQVFRVLDDEDQSAFTIRRYLDRAVFQASQIGEVIVFGDATNDATMEALELWRSDGRVDQVSVVPVSAILLTR